MSERKLNPVSDNKDKQKTYRALMGRYTLAVRQSFYFEALLIDYAMLEDRLRSSLYHLGFIYSRTSPNIWKSKRPLLSKIVMSFKGKDENDTLGITNISGKIKIIRCVLKWVLNSDSNINDRHLKAIKKQCGAIDIVAFLKAFDELEEWLAYRNEIMHALLNKNLESANSKKAELTIEGMRIARYLDSQVTLIKKRNFIRKSANAKIEW